MAVTATTTKNTGSVRMATGTDSSGATTYTSTTLGTMTADETDFTDQKLYNVGNAIRELLNGTFAGVYKTSTYSIMP